MIIPAVDLINGQVVRLAQGDFAAVTTFDQDPLTQLQAYEKAGSQLLHLVDLDGARDPACRQLKTLERLVSGLSAPVQVGGGVRSRQDVQALLDAGVARVVVGSLAVTDPALVAGWLEHFGADRLTVALDVRLNRQYEPEVVMQGWQQGSGQQLDAVIAPLLSAGLAHVLCTDIARDGMLTGPNIVLYHWLTKRYPGLVWQASGGVASLKDLWALRHLKIGGVIIGKALLEGRFTMEEALACWQNA